MRSVYTTIFDHVKQILINGVGIPENRIFLHILGDNLSKYYEIPSSMIYFDIANDENIFTKQYGYKSYSNTDNYNYTKVVNQTTNCIVTIYDIRNKIFLHKDNFYCSFKSDVVPFSDGDKTHNIKLNFKRNQIVSLQNEKINIAAVQVFMEFIYPLFYREKAGYKITEIKTDKEQVVYKDK